MLTRNILLLMLKCLLVQGKIVNNHVEVANQWLHHEMGPYELSRHFGVDDSNNVDGDMYQVIKIDTGSIHHDLNKRSGSDLKKMFDHSVKINAFDKEHHLPLRRQKQLISQYATVLVGGEQHEPPSNTDCHYSHHSDSVLASISNCDGYVGFVVDDTHVYEINPVHPDHQEALGFEAAGMHSLDMWHIITRRPHDDVILPEGFDGQLKPASNFSLYPISDEDMTVMKRSASKDKRGADKLTIEVGVFVDYRAKGTFMQFYNNDIEKVKRLMLTYVNSIQTYYHEDSLGREIDILITHLELMDKDEFPTHDGLRNELLTSFCEYQGSKNPDSDAENGHYDVGIFVSGLDFKTHDGSTITMGLATVTGMCSKKYGCVIGEIGVINSQGKPYPSTGFTATIVMGHEIGHNTGNKIITVDSGLYR